MKQKESAASAKKKKRRVWAGGLAVGLLASTVGAGQEKSPGLAVSAAEPFKLSGYTQALSTTQSAGLDGLIIRRARFTLIGEILKNLKIKVQVDVLKNPVLLDAQMDWTPAEAFGLRFGQFKVPFSLESTTSSADLETIERSQVVNKIAPGWDIGSSGRDMGLALTGKYSVIEYAVGIFNGAGINKADTNDHKDVSARFLVHPLGGLSIGVSLYDGLYSTAAGAPRTARDRIGYEAAWRSKSLSIRAEYIRAKNAALSCDGGYVQAGYFVLPQKIQVLFKYDEYDKNRAVSGDRIGATTAALNWFFAARTKLQLNYSVFRLEDGAIQNRVLQIQFQLAY
jgi:phosphate-selective porin